MTLIITDKEKNIHYCPTLSYKEIERIITKCIDYQYETNVLKLLLEHVTKTRPDDKELHEYIKFLLDLEHAKW